MNALSLEKRASRVTRLFLSTTYDKTEKLRIVTQRYAFWFLQPAPDNRLMLCLFTVTLQLITMVPKVGLEPTTDPLLRWPLSQLRLYSSMVPRAPEGGIRFTMFYGENQ